MNNCYQMMLSDMNNMHNFQGASRIFTRIKESTVRQTECTNTFELLYKVLKIHQYLKFTDDVTSTRKKIVKNYFL